MKWLTRVRFSVESNAFENNSFLQPFIWGFALKSCLVHLCRPKLYLNHNRNKRLLRFFVIVCHSQRHTHTDSRLRHTYKTRTNWKTLFLWLRDRAEINEYELKLLLFCHKNSIDKIIKVSLKKSGKADLSYVDQCPANQERWTVTMNEFRKNKL